MANAMFDVFPQSAQGEVRLHVAMNNDDVLQCGNCKKQFSSLVLFICHKQEPCTATLNAEDIVPSNAEVSHSMSTTTDVQYEEKGSAPFTSITTSSVPQETRSVVLNEAEFLSLTGTELSSSLLFTGNSSYAAQVSTTEQTDLCISSASSQQPLTTGTALSSTQFTNETVFTMAPMKGSPTSLFAKTVAPICVTNFDTGVIEVQDTNGINSTIEKDFSDNPSSPKGKTSETVKGNDKSDSIGKKIDKFQCNYCHKGFTANCDLQRHMRCHTGEKPFQCIVCDRGFTQRSNFNRHMQSHKVWPHGLSDTLPDQQIETVVKCESPTSCDDPDDPVNKNREDVSTFSSGDVKKSAGDEQMEVVIDNSYVCQYCSGKFKTYNKLRTHIVTHRNEMVYKCIMKACGETFHELDNFLEHAKTHENEMIYRCHICNKRFPSLCYLEVHQNTHSILPSETITPGASAEKPFSCTQCNASFSRNFTLKRHLLTHNPVKHLKCPFHNLNGCNKEFHHRDKLRAHILTHSGLKPHKCRHCDRAFTRSSHLRRHEQKHAQQESTFSCLTCKKNFTSEETLSDHACYSTARNNKKCATSEQSDLCISAVWSEQPLTMGATLSSTEFTNETVFTMAPMNGSPTALFEKTVTPMCATDIDGCQAQFSCSYEGATALSLVPIAEISLDNSILTSEIKDIDNTVAYSIVSESQPISETDLKSLGVVEVQEDTNSIGCTIEKALNDTPSSPKRKNRETVKRNSKSDSVGKKGDKFQCGYCYKGFTNNYHLQQHIRCHTGERPFQCIVCGRAFAQKSNIKKHMQSHKVWPRGLSRTLPDQRMETLDKCASPTSCDDPDDPVNENCEDVSTFSSDDVSKSAGDEQIKVVIDNSYVCQYCNGKFKTYRRLRTHLMTHKNEKVYKCIMKACGETFHELGTFLEHSKTHENEMIHRCHVCNKTFPSLFDLEVHQYTHSIYQSETITPSASGEKPFSCTQCNASFNLKYILKRHLLTHDPVKHFKCPFRNFIGCNKEFNRADKLRTHILTHSGLKLYKCRHCDRAYSRSSHLRQHEQKHTLHESTFSCVTCKKNFTSEENLSDHACDSTVNTSTALTKKDTLVLPIVNNNDDC